jgi:hypothetical protein
MDIYNRLRPNAEIESCSCQSITGLLLVDLMSDNPIHCAVCRREVDPERIKLTASETEAIAHWYGAASALYRLWLDSGEYEAYAKERLLDPKGQTNRVGRELAIAMSVHHPTQFWFFHDTDDGEPSHCPVCGDLLDMKVKWGTGMCRPCHIQL